MAARKTLLGSIGIIVVLNLVTKPLWVVVENVVQNALGHEVWGGYAAVLNLVLIVGALTELGVNQYTTKRLANSPESYASQMPYLLGLKLLLGGVFVLAVVLFGQWLGYGGQRLGVLLLVAAVQWLVGMLAFWRALMQAKQDFRLDAIAGIADRTLLTLPILALLAWGITLERFLWASVATSAFTLLLFGGIASKRYGWALPRWQMQRGKTLMRHSLPFALIFILFLVLEKINVILVERWAGEQQAGLFQGAYRFFGMFQMYLWTVLPVFYAKFAHGYLKPADVQQRLFNAGQGIVAVPMIAVCCFLWFYADKLFFLFTNSSPAELLVMQRCLKALSIAMLLNSVFNIYSTYLTATGKERYVSFLLVFAILLNVGTTLWLMPTLGAEAAAWGLVVAFAFSSLGYMYYLRRVTPLGIDVAKLLRLAVVLVVGVAAFAALAHWQTHWLLAGGIGTVLILGAALGLGLFDRKMEL